MTVKAESLLETSVQLRSLGWLGVDDHCPRDPMDISPVGMVAAFHLDLAIHNFRIQEHMRHGDATKEVFVQSFGVEDGYLHPGDEPGLVSH